MCGSERGEREAEIDVMCQLIQLVGLYTNFKFSAYSIYTFHNFIPQYSGPKILCLDSGKPRLEQMFLK